MLLLLIIKKIIDTRNDEIFKRQQLKDYQDQQLDQKLKEQQFNSSTSNLLGENMSSSSSSANATTTTTTMANAAAANESHINTTVKNYIHTSHTTKIENIDNGASSDGSDEDVLHVVTNVYTIPIIKSSSAGNGPFIEQSQPEMHISTSVDDDFINRHQQQAVINTSSSIPLILGEPRLEMQSKSAVHETRRVVKRVIDSTQQTTTPSNDQVPIVTAASAAGHEMTKSKFQIRSIVEIYENTDTQQQQQQQQQPDVGYFKASTQFQETTTKEIIGEHNKIKGKKPMNKK